MRESKYPVEALLRPPVELLSGTVALMAAATAAVAPWALMMPPELGWGTAICCSALAASRLEQAYKLNRYHRNLKRLPKYELTPDKVPVSNQRLFLGRGFRWEQKHTQRLKDTLRPEAAPYMKPGALYELARQKEIHWEHLWGLNKIAALLSRDAWWNPVAPLPPVGGRPELHAVEWNERDVYMPLHERVGHTLVLGTTRVGKTRLLEILVTQDIHRGEVVIVIDPKGDGELLRRMEAECRRAGRIDDFMVFHLGFPEFSARYNSVGNFTRITEIASRVAGQLSGEGNSAAFREFAWRFTNGVSRALVSLGQRPTYDLILRHVSNIESLFQNYCEYFLNTPALHERMRKMQPGWSPKDWQAVVAAAESSLKDNQIPNNLKSRQKRTIVLLNYLKDQRVFDPVLDGLRSAVEYDKTYFDKIVASLLPLLEKLTTGELAEIISPNYDNIDDERPILEWLSAIRRKCVVYVGLDALTDSEVAAAVGNSMFADLVSMSGYIYKHGTEQGMPGGEFKMPKISLHCDEFNELMGDEFIPMINKAGGSGVQVTAYTQTRSDIEAKIGNRAKAGQVEGNFNTIIMLRVKEMQTAKLMTDQLPKVDVNFLVQVSGANDSGNPNDGTGVTFTSRNEDRLSTVSVPLLEPNDIMTLPKGQAFVLIEGGQLWKVRMPLPSKKNDPMMSKNIQEMARRMDLNYRSSDSWWNENGGNTASRQSREWDEATGQAEKAETVEVNSADRMSAAREDLLMN